LGTASLLFGLLPSQTKARTDEPADAFTEAAASKLLNQVVEGLRGHSLGKMLGAFDLSRMEGGPLFKDQVTAFFNQYDAIRVHFKLVEVTANAVVVDAEMDATPPGDISPPQHKSAQLRFTATKTEAGWKFLEIQPRNFFS
jgi:hypothetical protein